MLKSYWVPHSAIVRDYWHHPYLSLLCDRACSRYVTALADDADRQALDKELNIFYFIQRATETKARYAFSDYRFN